MSHNVVSGLITVDNHWGATDPKQFHEELKICQIDKIRHLKQLDFYIIGGDTFDSKEYLASPTVKEFLLFMSELIDVTEPLNTQIRIILGTRTHDAMQLDTLDIIFNQLSACNRIKFINTVHEELLCGINLLYIPEEYVVDQDLYYEDYFSKHYDIIIGHGMVDAIWYAKNRDPNLTKQTTAPVFNVDELCKIGNYVYFGHVHEHKSYGSNKRFKYVGPITRWEFDKTWDCGYYLVDYDTTTNVMWEDFIINEHAPVLSTTGVSIKENMPIDQINQLIHTKIDSLMKRSDKTKLIVCIDMSLSTSNMIKDFIITNFGNVSRLYLTIKAISQEDDMQGISSNDITEKMKEKPYLYNTSLDHEERIAAFIRKNAGSNISLDVISDVIYRKEKR